MVHKDDLGDRMKAYEAVETLRRFDETLPVYARIDGRSFSRFTRDMQRPFDPRMTKCMIDVTKYLVKETHATVGYVQSDEISLAWDCGKLFFDGKIQKACSVLAGMSSAAFAVYYKDCFGNISQDFPHFDCRVLQMPTRTEVANMFLWRALDARKNAVSMAARHHFSHKQLQHKNTAEMMNMLQSIGAGMSTYPREFRSGTWVRRQTEQRTMTHSELQTIPEQYRPAPDQLLTRSNIVELDIVSFLQVTNREAVIFDGAVPVVA